MSTPILVTIELRFKTEQDPEQLAERVREAVRMIVGRVELEEFRWRAMPLGPEPGAVPGSKR
jgi:acetylornithine deacetylase/succinyl-diaminopimelate desuccinylase-like protein